MRIFRSLVADEVRRRGGNQRVDIVVNAGLAFVP
jgi:hypothetical protein